MVGTILKETAIVIIFCNFFVGGQDFLEYYKPKPGLPEELNQWLEDVQRYKKDFRLIRAIAKDPIKFGLGNNDDQTGNHKEHLLGSLDDNDYLDYGPTNDIYPHVYKQKNLHHSPNKIKVASSRLRRHSNNDNDIAIAPRSTKGEVKRADDKYPDRYTNNVNRRDVQIDVLNDGKLVKQIRDSDQDSKSIVLNIQPPEETKPPPPLYKPTEEVRHANEEMLDSPLKLFTPRSTIDLDSYPSNNKELSSNLHNLFNANENLNTDSSIARENLARTALVYRVTLPDPNLILQQTPAVATEGAKGFNNNGFKDMSQFWTVSEKNQLQKGIDFAQEHWEQKNKPSTTQKPVDDDGFELVKSVVVEDDKEKNEKQSKKRESETLEGQVDIGDGDGRRGSCNEGKCKEKHFDDDMPEDESKFQVKSDVFEKVPPVVTSVTLIDVEAGDEVAAVDHQVPAMNQETDLGVQDIENGMKEDAVPETIPVDDVSSGGNNPKVEAPKEDNVVNDILPETSEEPITQPEAEVKNIDELKPIESEERKPSHEINLEVDKDVGSGIEKMHQEQVTKMHIDGNIFVTGGEAATEPQEVKHPIHKQQHSKLEECNVIEDGLPDDREPPDSEEQTHNDEPEDHPRHKKVKFEAKTKEMARDKLTSSERKTFPSDHRGFSGDGKYKSREYNPPKGVPHCQEGSCHKDVESHRSYVDKSKVEYSPSRYEGRSSRRKHKKKKHSKKIHKHKFNNNDEDYDRFPSVDDDVFPAYSRRQLKTIEYVYDVDLAGPDEEYAEDIDKSTTKGSEILHKDSVEGEYGDEEDSMTSKKSKEASKLVKKTDNAFANPATTTTEAEEDEYYEEIDDESARNKEKSDAHKLSLHGKDEKLVSFGRRQHKKPKLPKNSAKPSTASKVEVKTTKPPVDGKKARPPRTLPSQRVLENSEFQQWPRFIRQDQNKEEILRKRATRKRERKKNNTFPLSSKDYFQKSAPKRSELDAGASSSTEKVAILSTKNPFEEKVTINLYLDDKGSSSGKEDITLFPVTAAQHQNGRASNAEEDECESETPKVSVPNVCEENENFNRTKVALTTVLSIVPDVQGELTNETYVSEEYEKLDEILNGHLPLRILAMIFGHVQNIRSLKERFLKGMKKPQPEAAFENLQEATNDESKKLVNAMANIMSRLQLTTTCQTLPVKLLHYLKSVTRVRIEDALARTKHMEEVEFDDAQNQDNFIFQSNARSDNLEEKVRVLKDLLVKFHHLPDRCKPRAEPVREYIENHLGMLSNMLGGGSELFANRPKKTILPDKSQQAPFNPGTSTVAVDLVQQQLESLGLGKQHNFRPKFDLDALIEHNKHPETEVERVMAAKSKRESNRDISEKFEKLLDAVEKKRSKRESEQRVAETFGRLSLEEYNGEGSRRGSFESPIVYSF